MLICGNNSECVELLDSDFLRVLSTSPLRSTSQRGVQDTLYIKIQGAPSLPSAPLVDMDAQMLATSTLMEHVMKKHGATGYQLAKDRNEAEALWAERRSALFVLTGYAQERGLVGYGMDVWCVHFSKALPCVFGDLMPYWIYSALVVPLHAQRAGLEAPGSGRCCEEGVRESWAVWAHPRACGRW